MAPHAVSVQVPYQPGGVGVLLLLRVRGGLGGQVGGVPAGALADLALALAALEAQALFDGGVDVCCDDQGEDGYEESVYGSGAVHALART